MRVAIYARYSSDNQRDASIADQLRICREFAARQGWSVVQEFTDHAISGATRSIDQSPGGVFKQILCAVGLAPTAVGVIRQALSLAWETHARVTCVCVMTEPSPSPSEIRTQVLAAIPS